MSMVAEEVRQLEAKLVEEWSLHSAWVHGTAVCVDANLVEDVEGYEIGQVVRQVHQQILG